MDIHKIGLFILITTFLFNICAGVYIGNDFKNEQDLANMTSININTSQTSDYNSQLLIKKYGYDQGSKLSFGKYISGVYQQYSTLGNFFIFFNLFCALLIIIWIIYIIRGI